MCSHQPIGLHPTHPSLPVACGWCGTTHQCLVMPERWDTGMHNRHSHTRCCILTTCQMATMISDMQLIKSSGPCLYMCAPMVAQYFKSQAPLKLVVGGTLTAPTELTISGKLVSPHAGLIAVQPVQPCWLHILEGAPSHSSHLNNPRPEPTSGIQRLQCLPGVPLVIAPGECALEAC